MKQLRSTRPSIYRLWPAILAVLLVGAACSNAGDPVSRTDHAPEQGATARDLSSIDELRG